MIAVTGSSGYVGGALARHLAAEGNGVLRLSRVPADVEQPAAQFALGQPFDERSLDGVEALVHAAWDFSARGRAVHDQNVLGVLPLLRAAATHDIPVVLISSLAAFDGCRSDYGRAKLELEHLVRAQGGVALRPGVVYGPQSGGIFGTIVNAVRRHRVVPLLTGRHLERLYLSDEESLAALTGAFCREVGTWPGAAVFAAHPEPVTLRLLVQEVGSALGRDVTIVPVPWRLPYLALRVGEGFGLRFGFRADSIRSLANPIPDDQLARLEQPSISFSRPSLTELAARLSRPV